MPDRAAQDQHRLAHWPFRTWRLFCIVGRGQEDPRKRLAVPGRLTPLACIDYLFLGDVEGDPLAVLNILEYQLGGIEIAQMAMK
eukprot:799924-Pyramimonas_sp.AAC.1